MFFSFNLHEHHFPRRPIKYNSRPREIGFRGFFLFLCFENTNPIRFDITGSPIILKRYFLIKRPLFRGGRLINTGRLINAGRLLYFVEITWALIQRGRLINAGRLIGYLRYPYISTNNKTKLHLTFWRFAFLFESIENRCC